MVLNLDDIKKHFPYEILNIGAMNRAGFPLGFTHSHRYVGPRTVLVGDAAHRVHPLAGQGVNLGFGDVMTLASVVEKCLKDGASLGDRNVLSFYTYLVIMI